jgi:hypothetical protein
VAGPRRFARRNRALGDGDYVTSDRGNGGFGLAALAGVLALLLAGCSQDGFPAVHDMPAPRADTPLSPDEVKAATDALISERDHLSSETQANGQPNAPPAPPGGSKPPTQKKTASGQAGAKPVATTGSTQTAGADSKP